VKNNFNMVSNYLKGIDQTNQSIRGANGIIRNSSRNQTLVVPTGTKKAVGRSTMDPSAFADQATSIGKSSLIGNRNLKY
jgi:hypothetical protein